MGSGGGKWQFPRSGEETFCLVKVLRKDNRKMFSHVKALPTFYIKWKSIGKVGFGTSQKVKIDGTYLFPKMYKD